MHVFDRLFARCLKYTLSKYVTLLLPVLQTKLIATAEDAHTALRHILQRKWVAVGCEGQDVSKEGRLCLLQVQHSSLFRSICCSVLVLICIASGTMCITELAQGLLWSSNSATNQPCQLLHPTSHASVVETWRDAGVCCPYLLHLRPGGCQSPDIRDPSLRVEASPGVRQHHQSHARQWQAGRCSLLSAGHQTVQCV